MSAVLFAIALVLALATTNLGAYIFSSLAIPLMALLTLPLWILYGFVFRKWWLVRKAKKEIR